MGSHLTSSLPRDAGHDVCRPGNTAGHGRVFGILAYSVQQRVRDFGVDRALGATTNDVLRLVVGSAPRTVALGVGLALSSLLGRMPATMLFGVRPLDPVTFASVTMVLALATGSSVAGPAWRAARIDPAVALRSE